MSGKSMLNLKPTQIEEGPKSILSKGVKRLDSKGNSLRVSVNNSGAHSKKSSSSSSDSSSSQDSSRKRKRDSSGSGSTDSRKSSAKASRSPKLRGADETLERQPEEEDEDELVKFNVSFTQLNDYLNNIIKVVNQHAKLLDTLNKEVQLRTTEKQVGEIFTLVATGLPYDMLVKKLGGQAPARRGSVMKLLGDASLLPAGVSLTSQGLVVQSSSKQPTTEEMAFGVTHNKLPSKA